MSEQATEIRRLHALVGYQSEHFSPCDQIRLLQYLEEHALEIAEQLERLESIYEAGIVLSPADTKRFDEIMAGPFEPNEKLKEAAQRYQEAIDSGRLKVTP